MVLSHPGAGVTQDTHRNDRNHDPYLTPHSRVHPGSLADLSVEHTILKLLGNNQGEAFS